MELNINVKIDNVEKIIDALNLWSATMVGILGEIDKKKTPEGTWEVGGCAAVEEPKAVESIENKDKTKEEIKEEVKENIKTAEKETKYTEAEVRQALVDLNSPTNRPKIKEILEKYGAKNISSLKEENYTDVMKDLEDLK